MKSKLSRKSVKKEKPVKHPECKLVQVFWWDAASSLDNRWRDIKEIAEIKPQLICSVGFLVEENPKCIVIVPHLCWDFDVGSGEIMVPHAQIDTIREIS